jgi:prepilin-type N-terminal cleavage/methylation domain-containing protein
MSFLQKRGFTLIELLLVISIISLLSTVVLGAVGESRDKAAIVKFKEDARQVANALELYRTDNGFYPPFWINIWGGPIHTLRNDYLSSYMPPISSNLGVNIKSMPVIPGTLKYVHNPTFQSNPHYFKCGDYNPGGYVLTFETSNNQAAEDYGFQRLKNSTSQNGPTWNNNTPQSYCIIVPIQ